MKHKVFIEIEVDGEEFVFPSDAQEFIEAELSFPEDTWDKIKIDYVKVDTLSHSIESEVGK